jgi:hypothetical protein
MSTMAQPLVLPSSSVLSSLPMCDLRSQGDIADHLGMTNETVIGIKAPGGPEVLVPEDRPVTPPEPGEILVKVAA